MILICWFWRGEDPFFGEIEILKLDEPNHAKLKAHGSATDILADAVSEMQLAPQQKESNPWETF